MKTVALCWFLIASSALAQVPIPQTPAGSALSQWLEAYNSGDPTLLQAYKRAHHRGWAVQDMIDSREGTGGYEVIRIEKSEPLALTAILKERDSDTIRRETVSVDSGAPSSDFHMTVEDLQRFGDLMIPRLTRGRALKSLVNRADALAAQDKFSGAILVASHGKVLLDRAWGDADRSTKTPNTVTTQFRDGSMNKMFTAVAILQLAGAHRISLDGTVGQYLPDYPNADVRRVTIRELLSHMGGTGDIFGPEFDANRAELKSNADYVTLYGTRGLDHAPGKTFSYSNYGFVLLGQIIARVSGGSYYDYIDQHVFKPAGMSHTGELPESVLLPHRAVGYMRKNGAWVRDDDTLPYRGTAAGGGYTTVGDMLRFVDALQSGKLVSKKLFGLATTPVFHDQPSGYGYGYGFELYGAGDFKSFGHEGGADGMNGELRVFPKLDRVIVVLSNFDPPAAHRLVEYYALRMPATP